MVFTKKVEECFSGQLGNVEIKLWYYRFISFLKKHACPCIEEVKNCLLEDNAIEFTKHYSWYFIEMNSSGNFFNYLESICCEGYSDYLKEGIEYAIRNRKNFENILIAFMNYVVITNFDDIKFYWSSQNKEESVVTGNLGYFVISSMILNYQNGYKFDEVEIREGLQNNNVGSLMFKEVCKKILKESPGSILYANNVWTSNDGGIRFYKKLGAELSKIVLDNKTNLKAEFDENAINKIAGMEVPKPKLYSYETLYFNNPTIEIKDYLERIICSQTRYFIDGGFTLPKKLMVPSEIILSPSVVKTIVEDKNVECIGACKDSNYFQVSWLSINEEVNIIIEIKKTDDGDFELVKFKEIYGQSVRTLYNTKNPGKARGVLTIMDNDDELSDIHRLSKEI